MKASVTAATFTSDNVHGHFGPPEPVDEHCPVCHLVLCGGRPDGPRCKPEATEPEIGSAV